jgi:uncharacterized repeat protein (TIGR02543 family)
MVCTDVSDNGRKYIYGPVDEFLGVYMVKFASSSGYSGRLPTAMTVIPGDSITLPGGNGLTRSEYFFDGWTTDSYGNGKNYAAGSTYKPDGSVTLYVKWNRTYTVRFDANYGTGTVPETITVDSGSSVTLPDGDGLTRSGYYFDGWTTNSYGSGTNYSAGSTRKRAGKVTR